MRLGFFRASIIFDILQMIYNFVGIFVEHPNADYQCTYGARKSIKQELPAKNGSRHKVAVQNALPEQFYHCIKRIELYYHNNPRRRYP